MSVLDVVMLGFLATSILKAPNPEKSSGEMIGGLVMGVLGAIAGAFAASAIFGIRVPFVTIENIALAGGGILFLLLLGQVFKIEKEVRI